MRMRDIINLVEGKINVPEYLQIAIRKFAEMHPKYATPEGAWDNCKVASSQFCTLAKSMGAGFVAVDEVAGVDGVSHYAALIDDIFVDWTARQFDKNAPWPVVFGEQDWWPIEPQPDRLLPRERGDDE